MSLEEAQMVLGVEPNSTWDAVLKARGRCRATPRARAPALSARCNARGAAHSQRASL
jgi:hypothetical protein